ncbi:carboxypeptidase-like regulatory domain-containing protein [Gramella sp. KN1008]|uniref:carboxypeptidase-like regulatory domain-containing protein n=1 Tax=Gramella sp. KN1008 TaxID=2529298 RepID=UPI00103B72E9|nr:carboxypeptidase-like regulatory domain-containing protein [Gramella sp. KN1008]TBW29949.1 carboxypeptidase regulatory-like domain-containing protein [Gramella sp. KN1008]
MKIFKTIFFVLLFIQAGFAQKGMIRGHIQDTVKNEGVAFAKVLINELDRETGTDVTGDFSFGDIPPGTYSLQVWIQDYPGREIDSIVIAPDGITDISILFPPECNFNHNDMTCPVCNKKDEVIPIVYGLPREEIFKKAEEGKVKLGGCVVSTCDPQWYCKRDKKSF